MLPAPHVIKALYGEVNVQFISWFYSFITMILALLAATVCGVAYAIDPAYVNNIYMASAVCVVVFMLIVFCSDFQSATFAGCVCCVYTLGCDLGGLWDGIKSLMKVILGLLDVQLAVMD